MKRSFFFLYFLASAFTALAQADTTQHIIAGRTNSPEQQQKPYVILVSADGFRYDYADKYKAKNLLALRQQGVQAQAMLPSFPSKTFPNHYTLVTGLYPAHHGLINNKFYDGKRHEFYTVGDRSKVEDGSWYGGVPLWVLAEQQQMLTASFFWVGSEAPIKGIHPTYYYTYNEAIPLAKRIQTVENWLRLPEEKRPHLITFYMPEVDHAGHNYGPDAPETERAVQLADSAMQLLTSAVARTGLPVNIVFVSDHGMTQVDTEHTLSLPASIDTSKFILSEGDVTVELFAKNKKDIRPIYRQLKKEALGYKVYLKTNTPRRWHYGAKDDCFGRVGDILLIPEWPKIFHSSPRKPVPGHHGYDPDRVKEMGATFYAWGPAFKKHLVLPPFRNVQVYPLITELLGLEYTHKIDGNKKLVKKVL
ncbi:ectonucleotide pyrophosphatase/phosphodiesterase [Pontibacter liquoris]|uniref:alkaline phosphatase family protein n=1 Tax=Pontibacter liquoris TaxID=2905677 RepID=UPI001FA775FE|nr:ectonucleotide pyrophosphatase/phosphodiesterase [Pontibacter liquoris]